MSFKSKILCVDDEPNVLDGLTLNLRRHYEVVTAPGGAQGLEILAREPDIAVIISDMRMPGMDGATFLKQAREVLPEAVRMLLTGQTDIDSAVAAVNEGQIFRFLTKPCAPTALLTAISAAVEQHRLITAERVLLEQTLNGTIRTLMDVLALTNPLSFGRASRIKQLVIEIADKLDVRERWQIEVAAMLSQLGTITLPPDIIERVYHGRPLAEHEQKMVARVPQMNERLLKRIPRLEVVRNIMARLGGIPAPVTLGEGSDKAQVVERGVQILRVATDFDEIESQGTPAAQAVNTLRGRTGRYDEVILEVLAQLKGGSHHQEIREIPLAALREGMRLAEDVRTSAGVLLVPRGYEVTAGFIERIRNFRPGTVKEQLQIIMPSDLGMSE